MMPYPDVEELVDDVYKVVIDNDLITVDDPSEWDEFDEVAWTIHYGDKEQVQELFDLIDPYIDDDFRKRMIWLVEQECE
jgi:hypothetical protein